MAVYRKLDISFWQDGFVLDLEPEEKYFYLYLMTNSKTSQSGIYAIHKRIMVLETGFSSEKVEELLQRFINYEKILYDYDTDEIFLINWIKFNWSNSEKVISKVKEELKALKNQDFAQSYMNLCIEYGYSTDTLWIEERQKEKEKEKEEEEREEETEKTDRVSDSLSPSDRLVEKYKIKQPTMSQKKAIDALAGDELEELMYQIDHSEWIRTRLSFGLLKSKMTDILAGKHIDYKPKEEVEDVNFRRRL